jgi:hypothetical protein
MPPKPPVLSCASLHTLQVRPTDRAIVCASRAICAGGMSPAGVFTRSRAQQTASTTIDARFTAAERPLASHFCRGRRRLQAGRVLAFVR